MPPSCWHHKRALGLTPHVPALAPTGLRTPHRPGWEQGPSGSDKQVLFQEHPTIHGDAKRNPSTPPAAKKIPSNQQFASCGCQGDDGGCVWCYLPLGRAPAPAPRGRSPGVIVGARGQARKQEPEDHIPLLLPVVLRAKGVGQTMGRWTIETSRWSPPTSAPPAGATSLPGLPKRSGLGPRLSWLQTPALHLPTMGFWKEI